MLGFFYYIYSCDKICLEVKMSICIFSGTFNPIHKAHLEVAKYALKKYNFEKIIFIPAYLPPHKEIDKNLAQHRFEMVKLAIKNEPKFEISDIEFQNEGKSYSLITVQKIIEKYKLKEKLNFIIGTDAFEKIESWYKVEELKKLVHFIVFPRGIEIDKEYFLSKGFDFELTDKKFLDISSTNIRKQKQNGNLEIVEGYIKKNGLYKN